MSVKKRHINRLLARKAAVILARHGVKKASLFGSHARGEQKPRSDYDLLVEFHGRKSLMEVVGIEQELSDALGLKVDLVTEKSVSPYIIDRIKKEMVTIRR
ncbi:MAG TPA: hypothetical protein DDW31_09020 [candidate division Zixibacteria bacterium]|jgi:hypothetical protein|nr:hypothetical protein [candidate division Zixibacteria bacterium]